METAGTPCENSSQKVCHHSHHWVCLGSEGSEQPSGAGPGINLRLICANAQIESVKKYVPKLDRNRLTSECLLDGTPEARRSKRHHPDHLTSMKCVGN